MPNNFRHWMSKIQDSNEMFHLFLRSEVFAYINQIRDAKGRTKLWRQNASEMNIFFTCLVFVFVKQSVLCYHNKLSTIGLPLRGRHPYDSIDLRDHNWRTTIIEFFITLSPRAEWSFLRVVSSLLLVPDGEMSVILISPLWRCCRVTLSWTCSSLLISEAVLEHADVFADRMRLPEAGINLSVKI